jgi:ubiquinone/menaquinone biosynthesis C-methylase UbiE
MPANYDHIAGFYDLMSSVIYGRSIVRAQVCLIPFIAEQSRILIVGGGTGWILEEIASQYPHGLEIDYIESSARMISLSRKRHTGSNTVHLIHQSIENHTIEKPYDVIITPFVLDNFSSEKIGPVYNKLDSGLKRNGLWLYADFVYDKEAKPLWQALLLKVMYFFFHITTGIETRELIPMDDYFRVSYHPEYQARHYFAFIHSIVYRKL